MAVEVTPEIQALIDNARREATEAARRQAVTEGLSGLETLKQRLAALEQEKAAAEESAKAARRAAQQAEVKRLALAKGLVSERLLAHPDFSFDEAADPKAIDQRLEELKLAEPSWFKPVVLPPIPAPTQIVSGVPAPASPPVEAVPTEQLLPGGLDFRKLLAPDGSFDLQTFISATEAKGLNARDVVLQNPPPKMGIF